VGGEAAWVSDIAWGQTPKLTCLPTKAQYGRARGWPAKPNEYMQIIEDSFILPDMVAKAVTRTPIDQAIPWGEEHVRKVSGEKAGEPTSGAAKGMP
jgi:hypothetical protein